MLGWVTLNVSNFAAIKNRYSQNFLNAVNNRLKKLILNGKQKMYDCGFMFKRLS